MKKKVETLGFECTCRASVSFDVRRRTTRVKCPVCGKSWKIAEARKRSKEQRPEWRAGKKVTLWGLKSPLGWFVEGRGCAERGLFTHTKDLREASRYTSKGAVEALKRAEATQETGAVTIERILVTSGESPGFLSMPYFVIGRGNPAVRRYLAALPLTDPAQWTKWHPNALHFPTHETANETLEKIALEDRRGATIEYVFMGVEPGPGETERSEKTPPPRGAESLLPGTTVKHAIDGIARAYGVILKEKKPGVGRVKVRWRSPNRPAPGRSLTENDVIEHLAPSELEVIEDACDPDDQPGEIKCFGCEKKEHTDRGFPTIKKLLAHLLVLGWEVLEEKALVHCPACSKVRKARAERKKWVIQVDEGYVAFGGLGVKDSAVETTDCATHFTDEKVAGEWAARVGGTVKPYFPIMGPTSVPSTPLFWVVEIDRGGRLRFFSRSLGRRDKFVGNVDRATHFDTEAEAHEEGLKWGGRVRPIYMTVKSVEPCVGDQVQITDEAPETWRGCTGEVTEVDREKERVRVKMSSDESVMYFSRAQVHVLEDAEKVLRNGDLVRHRFDEGFSDATGVVQSTSESEDRIRVRWSRSSTPGEPTANDIIVFHESHVLRKITAEEERLLESRDGASFCGMPTLNVSGKVLAGLVELRAMWREKSSVLEGEERDGAVRYASMWIRALSKSMRVSCAGCREEHAFMELKRGLCRKCRRPHGGERTPKGTPAVRKACKRLLAVAWKLGTVDADEIGTPKWDELKRRVVQRAIDYGKAAGP